MKISRGQLHGTCCVLSAIELIHHSRLEHCWCSKRWPISTSTPLTSAIYRHASTGNNASYQRAAHKVQGLNMQRRQHTYRHYDRLQIIKKETNVTRAHLQSQRSTQSWDERKGCSVWSLRCYIKGQVELNKVAPFTDLFLWLVWLKSATSAALFALIFYEDHNVL